MNELERKFYGEIKDNIKDFTDYLIQRLKGQKEKPSSDVEENYKRLRMLKLSENQYKDLRKIIEDAMVGSYHSTFVSIDGGTAISDHGKAIELIDFKTGQPLTKGALYENFIGYYYYGNN